MKTWVINLNGSVGGIGESEGKRKLKKEKCASGFIK